MKYKKTNFKIIDIPISNSILDGHCDLEYEELMRKDPEFKEKMKLYDEKFEPEKFFPIELAFNNGRWFILEGYHRVYWARRKGFKKIRAIIPKKYKLSDLKDSTKLFEFHNLENTNTIRQFIDTAREKWSYLRKNLYLFHNKDILDVGSCTGFFSFEFARVANKVYGIENNSSFVKEAKIIAKENNINNVEFIKGDILDIHKKVPKVDIVWCGGLLHNIKRVDLGMILLGLLANKELIISIQIIKGKEPKIVKVKHKNGGKNYKVTLSWIYKYYDMLGFNDVRVLAKSWSVDNRWMFRGVRKKERVWV